MNDQLPYSSTILYASLAALISRTLTHPLDTYKTLSQYSSLRHTSLRQYYKALPISLAFSVPATAMYLSAYDGVKLNFGISVLKKQLGMDEMGIHVLSAMAAELSSGVLWTPMEVIKCKSQIHVARSTSSIISNLYRAEGIRGFYRGYVMSQYVFVPYTVVYFVIYERLKKQWESNRWISATFKNQWESNGWMCYTSSSIIAATVAGAVSNPLDVIKVRMQVDAKTVGVVLKEVYRDHGVFWGLRGMGARIGWIVPSMACSMTCYEMMKDAAVKRM